MGFMYDRMIADVIEGKMRVKDDGVMEAEEWSEERR